MAIPDFEVMVIRVAWTPDGTREFFLVDERKSVKGSAMGVCAANLCPS